MPQFSDKILVRFCSGAILNFLFFQAAFASPPSHPSLLCDYALKEVAQTWAVIIPAGKVTPGGSSQLFIEGLDERGLPTKADAIGFTPEQMIATHADANASVQVTQKGADLEWNTIGQIGIKLEIDPDQGHLKSVQFAFESEDMLKHREANPVKATLANQTDPDKFYESDGLQTKVMLKNIKDFFALQFVAKAKSPVTWRVNLETDASQELSAKLGKKVFFQSSFVPKSDLNYFTLPFADFKVMIDGKADETWPGILSGISPESGLNLRSIEFEPLNSADSKSADLTLHDSQVGAGFSYGANMKRAKKLLLELADDYESSSFDLVKDPRDTYLLPERKISSDIRTVVGMMDHMEEKLKGFPQFDGFKDIPEKDRRLYLFHSGGTYQQVFGLGATFLGEKVTLTDVWRNLIIYGGIPTESGYFGQLHSDYGHVFQIAAMLDDTTVEEQMALKSLLAPRRSFLFYWSLFFDSREGGANDPASWKFLEEYSPFAKNLNEIIVEKDPQKRFVKTLETLKSVGDLEKKVKTVEAYAKHSGVTISPESLLQIAHTVPEAGALQCLVDAYTHGAPPLTLREANKIFDDPLLSPLITDTFIHYFAFKIQDLNAKNYSSVVDRIKDRETRKELKKELRNHF